MILKTSSPRGVLPVQPGSASGVIQLDPIMEFNITDDREKRARFEIQDNREVR